MKIKSVLSCFVSLALATTLLAELPTSEENKTTTSVKAPNVGQEIKDLTYVLKGGAFAQQAPKVKAKYFLILSSASWCAPCREEMPEITKEYEKIKNNPSVELILLSADKSKETALKWAVDEKTSFPIILPGTPNLPKSITQKNSQGIPHLVILTSEGKVIAEDHPAYLMKGYKSVIAKDNEGSFPE